MQTPEDMTTTNETQDSSTTNESRKKQQQTDPQKTEFKGFFDKKEKLEPDLEDDKESKTEKE